MKAALTIFRYILIYFLAVVMLAGCREKGCTNPAAINYNSVAEEDDGSCILCQSTYEDLGTQFDNLIDNFSSGPHFNTTVAWFSVVQQRVTYNSELCGSTGECILIVKVQSTVNEKMTINYNLQCFGGLNFSFNDIVTVPGHQTIAVDTLNASMVSFPCADISSSILSVSLNSQIIYE